MTKADVEKLIADDEGETVYKVIGDTYGIASKH